MKRALVTYSSINGQTKKICQRVCQRFEAHQFQVDCIELEQVSGIDLALYDKIIIGASIHYGKHRPDVSVFLEQNQDILVAKDAAFFSVNVVARKPHKNTPATNPYMQKFLASLSWQPKDLHVFGGLLDYSKYGFLDKHMIRFIMWMTKGPTDPKSKIDYTDWDQVNQFADRQATK